MDFEEWVKRSAGYALADDKEHFVESLKRKMKVKLTHSSMVFEHPEYCLIYGETSRIIGIYYNQVQVRVTYETEGKITTDLVYWYDEMSLHKANSFYTLLFFNVSRFSMETAYPKNIRMITNTLIAELDTKGREVKQGQQGVN